MNPNEINIKVTSNNEDNAKAVKQLEDLRKANKKLEDEGDKAHEKQKKQHKEKIDLGKKLQEGIKEIGTAIVAAFAVEKIIEFGKECVKAFEDAEEAASQLAFAVGNIGKEGAESLEKLTQFNERFTESTNNLFSGKDVDKAESQLVKFGLTTEQVTKLLPRLGGAAAQTGVTLEEMAGKVSSAFINGPRALNKELGTQIAKSGDQVRQFELIYNGLADFADGVNKKLETSAGKSQASANKLEKTQEELGSKLAPLTEQAKSNFYYNINNIVNGIEKLFGDGDKKIESGLEKQTRLLKEGQAKAKEELQAKNEPAAETGGKTQLQKYLDEIQSLSDKNIEIKIQAAEDENEMIYKGILPAGYKELESALKKEQDLRKKNQDDYKNKIKQFYADLEAIRKKDADENAKLDIALIKDETEKKLAQEKDGYNKEIEALEVNEKKLLEISTKGNAEQRTQALKELDKLYHDKELALQVYNQNVLNINKEHNQKVIDQDLAANEEQMRHDKAMYDANYEASKEQLDTALAEKKISIEKYNADVQALELARAKDAKQADLAADDATIEALNKKLELQIANGDDTTDLDEQLKKAQNKRDEDAAKDQLAIQKQLDANKLAAAKKFAEQVKAIAEQVNEIAQTALNAATDVANSNIDVMNSQLDEEARMIDVQKSLAQKGLDNDLAFEEKRADELEKQKIKEQIKLKKIKELETFLNAVAQFSEQDPKTALPKALTLLAATKAAEAVYAEEGGIIGQINAQSMIGTGMSRRHSGGGDVLLHAQKGEGIFSVKEMNNLGVGNFNMLKSMLKSPFNEKLLPSKGSSVMVQDNTELINEVKALKTAIMNKKEVSIDFDEMNQWIKTEVENGIKKVTKHFNPNARRKF
jgi:hypothetical protein